MQSDRLAVSSGIWRIRSKSNPALYLVAGPTYLEVAPLDVNDRKQAWKLDTIDPNANGGKLLVTITNLASQIALSSTPPTSSERDYRVLTNKAASVTDSGWKIPATPIGVHTEDKSLSIIAPGSDSRAIDLSQDNRVILWEVNNHDNQRWFFEQYIDTAALKEGQYRIRNKERANPDKYLYLKDDKNVSVTTLDTSAKAQIWKVVHPAASNDWWEITNAATGEHLYAKKTDEGKYILRGGAVDILKEMYSLWVTDPLEADGSFIIGASINPSGQVIDLAVDDWVVLWEPNKQARQYWYFEKV